MKVRQRPQPLRKAKTAALYGIPIQMVRSYISGAMEASSGFMCKACGESFQAVELACRHLRAYSDISPHPYVRGG